MPPFRHLWGGGRDACPAMAWMIARGIILTMQKASVFSERLCTLFDSSQRSQDVRSTCQIDKQRIHCLAPDIIFGRANKVLQHGLCPRCVASSFRS